MKEIDQDTYLKALGLFTMAREHAKKAREFELVLINYLGVNEGEGYGGHVSDEIYSTDDALSWDALLERAGIKLKK